MSYISLQRFNINIYFGANTNNNISIYIICMKSITRRAYWTKMLFILVISTIISILFAYFVDIRMGYYLFSISVTVPFAPSFAALVTFPVVIFVALNVWKVSSLFIMISSIVSALYFSYIVIISLKLQISRLSQVGYSWTNVLLPLIPIPLLNMLATIYLNYLVSRK